MGETFGYHIFNGTLEGHCTAPGSDAEALACEYETMVKATQNSGNTDSTISTISKVRLFVLPPVLLPDPTAKLCVVATKGASPYE